MKSMLHPSLTLVAALTALLVAATVNSSAADVASKVNAGAATALKVHPKVFSMVECLISDEMSPVVTEFNLDALESNGNQFYAEEVKRDGDWTQSPNEDGTGFFRYRVTEAKDNRYKVEFLNNGGGTLTTKSTIDCVIDKREIKIDGKAKTFRVLRIVGYALFVPKEK
jgi:hypothetical protein